MPSNFSKGRGLEYVVRDRLRAEGFVVFRYAGSRPVDLIAIREGRILLVECKTGRNPYFPPNQLSHIVDGSEKGKPIKRGTQPFFNINLSKYKMISNLNIEKINKMKETIEQQSFFEHGIFNRWIYH